MKILITGASGFLGRKLVERCIKQGIDIHVLGRNIVNLEVEFTKIDICDMHAVVDSIQSIKPTHIMHLASQGVTRDNSSLQDLLLVNTVATDNLLQGASRMLVKPQVFMMGTAYEYESSDQPLKPDGKVNPKSPYAISKTASAFCMARYADLLPMQYLRLFNIYGPGEPRTRIIPHIVDCALKGEPVNLTGCDQLRDFMFVDDLIDILLFLLSRKGEENPEILNIGTGIPVSLKAVVLETAHQLEHLGVAVNLRFGALPYRKDDPMVCYADASQMLSKVGSYTFTQLSEGIRRTVERLYESNR